MWWSCPSNEGWIGRVLISSPHIDFGNQYDRAPEDLRTLHLNGMEQILSEQLKKALRERFEYSFRVPQAGLHVIAVSVRLEKGALHFVINNRRFHQLALSGIKRSKQLQTLYVVLYLTEGEHRIAINPEGNVFLEELLVTYHTDATTLLALELNIQAADGDRRRWLTFGLVDLAVEAITVTATARWRLGDSDDLKLVVNGAVQKNTASLFWREWLWSGSLLKKLRQAETQTKTIAVNLASGIHAIEFWADRMPTLHRVEFTLGVTNAAEPTRPRTYAYRGVRADEDYNRFDTAIADAVKYWNEVFFKQEYPPPEPLDPSLVKAIIYIESRMGYYPGGYPDIMQVGNTDDPALHTLNHDGWIDPRTQKPAEEYEWQDGKTELVHYGGTANAATAEMSILWGVRWLYHKAQTIQEGKRVWTGWREAVKGYGGRADYVRKVWRAYQEGVTPQGEKLWAIFLVGLGLAGAAAFMAGTRVSIPSDPELHAQFSQAPSRIRTPDDPRHGELRSAFEQALAEYDRKKDERTFDKLSSDFSRLGEKCRRLGCIPEVAFEPSFSRLLTTVDSPEEVAQAGEALGLFFRNGWALEDFDNDGADELVFVKSDFLSHGWSELVVVDEVAGRLVSTSQKFTETGYLYSARSNFLEEPLKALDLTGDGIPEILFFVGYWRFGAQLFVFQYERGKLYEIFHAHELVYSRYTLSDLNHNGVVDITVDGFTFGTHTDGGICYACLEPARARYEYAPERGVFLQR